MNVGSLFAGIGGFDLGFERVGMRTVWFCEQDRFCQQVLAKRWPGVPCYPDVCKLRGNDVQSVDVLCGGFPCQDLSYAGRGAGIDGARSGLWSEYARLIGELRPRYVVMENVPALLRRGFGRVLRDLAACGYDAEWDCIPACAFGAPHRRDRVWIVAYPDRPRLSDAEGCSRQAESNRQPIVGAVDAFSGSHDWLVEPDVGRVADGVPARVDRLRSLGNALVPQIAEWIGTRIMDYESEECT